MSYSRENFQSALRLLLDDQKSKGVFDFMQRQSAASGWEIAKNLDEDPTHISGLLATMRKTGIIDSNGSGLEGYYHLSDLGYQLREYFNSPA